MSDFCQEINWCLGGAYEPIGQLSVVRGLRNERNGRGERQTITACQHVVNDVKIGAIDVCQIYYSCV